MEATGEPGGVSDKEKAKGLLMRRRKINGFCLGLLRYCAFFPLLFVTVPLCLINWLLLWKSTRAKCGRVRITSLEKDHENFVAVTLAALALIEKHDPKRYARLQKELLFITDAPGTAYAAYAHDFRECRINWNGSAFDWAKGNVPAAENAHYAWYLASYAATLVHEATHGRLHSLGFSYTKQTRVQCERICEAEARRFAAHLPQTEYDFAHDLRSPFDPARWEAEWNKTAFQHFKEVLHRIRHQGKERRTGANEPVEAIEGCPAEKPLTPPLQSPPRQVTGSIVLKPTTPKEPYSIWPKPAASDAPQDNLPVVEMPEWAAPLVRARFVRKKVKAKVKAAE